jgi:ribosome-associated heat shock protein Hsp15
VTQPGPCQRLDLWLWYTRLCKSRSLAARMCAAGLVELGDAVALKPAHPVRPGDVIRLNQGRNRLTVRVEGLGQRRGPPLEARALYQETAPRVPLAAIDPEWIPLLAEDETPAHYEG